ncbi:MAG: hypothetical protein IT204_20395 [Fimbriimonadaceae bacterium]|nr:hypothetical protein [Fimbriimonadaceae bacterium]
MSGRVPATTGTAGDRSYPLNATTAAVAIGDLPALAAELRGAAGSP